jgi:hypothetical protein
MVKMLPLTPLDLSIVPVGDFPILVIVSARVVVSLVLTSW